jgi:hypothetical protein
LLERPLQKSVSLAKEEREDGTVWVTIHTKKSEASADDRDQRMAGGTT